MAEKMSRIAFCGDIHGNIRFMYHQLAEWQERTGLTLDGVVQVGDFGIMHGTEFDLILDGSFEVPIRTLVIPGNHEDYRIVSKFDWPGGRGSCIGNLRIFDTAGGADKWHGVGVVGLGGNYSPKSYNNPERVMKERYNASIGAKYNNRIAVHITKTDVFLTGGLSGYCEGLRDVLVTHDSAQATLPPWFVGKPLGKGIGEVLGLDSDASPGGCPGFDDLLRLLKPKYYFFGHLHTSYRMDYVHDDGSVTKVQCLNSIENHEEGQDGWMEVVEFGEEGNNARLA